MKQLKQARTQDRPTFADERGVGRVKIPFTKMHGAGNDYCYVSAMGGEPLPDPAKLALAMSPRHFSVGSDGVIFVCPPENPENDGRMRMFNADGSEGKMCGNGIRCVGKFLYDKGFCPKEKTTIRVETLSGVKTLRLFVEAGEVVSALVEMGRAEFDVAKIPCLFEKSSVREAGIPETSTGGTGKAVVMINEPVEVAGKTVRLTAVSMGNPHAVLFLDEIEGLNLAEIGPSFERHPLFPERVNTEFVKVIDRTHLAMRVWERGSGETYACGTGTCASVAAAIACGYCDFETPVSVRLLGGELTVTVKKDGTALMEGPCETVYEGVYFYRDEKKEE